MLARLEAVMLLANEPLNTRKLAQLASLEDGTKARMLLRQLNERYDSAARAFRVEEVAGGYQLRTRPNLPAGFVEWSVRRRKSGCPPHRWKLWPLLPIANPCCEPKLRPCEVSNVARFCGNSWSVVWFGLPVEPMNWGGHSCMVPLEDFCRSLGCGVLTNCHGPLCCERRVWMYIMEAILRNHSTKPQRVTKTRTGWSTSSMMMATSTKMKTKMTSTKTMMTKTKMTKTKMKMMTKKFNGTRTGSDLER